MSKYAYEQIKEMRHLIAEIKDYAKEVKDDIALEEEVSLGDREDIRSASTDILRLCGDIEQLLNEIP